MYFNKKITDSISVPKQVTLGSAILYPEEGPFGRHTHLCPLIQLFFVPWNIEG